jgi:hypothetical protein
MPYFLKGNCVHEGTKEDPGELVTCHDTHNEAVAHLRALYVNVEDAEKVYVEVDGEMHEFVKGGPGSGWHKPPQGTHNAENAPNFAGGPGADRKYGTESDEPPDKTRRCKCTKCNAVIILPKGKQCEDIKCPACGGGATQTEWREDKPAEGRGGRKPAPGQKKSVGEEACPACEEEEKAMDAPGPTVHGEGGSLSEGAAMDDEGKCKCPKCGKGIPCTAKACPYCKESIDKVERMESDKRAMKAEQDGQHPAGHYLVAEDPESPSTWHLRYKDADGSVNPRLLGAAWAALHGGYRGNKYEGPKKAEALAKLRELYKREGMATPSEKSFTVYKSSAGDWRWLSISNWAVVDKEAEVVSEQAYKDAIAHAQKSAQWGELDLVHVDGTDVGDCDMMFVLKSGEEPAKLGAGGTWHDNEKATRVRKALQAKPDYWGMSVKFRFNPQRKVRGIYTGDIQVLKHTILPQQMAASYGTAIAVQGGESMSKVLDEKTQDALRQLGHTEDEIAELAEKNKAAPPQEENVVEKEETTEAGAQENALIAKIKGLLGMSKPEAPVASEPEEAESDKEVAPAEPEEEVKAEEAGADEIKPDAEALKAMGVAIAQSLGEALNAELEKRDAQIAALTEQVKAMSGSIEEKVEARLRDVPPVVKVAPTMVGATATGETAPQGGPYAELIKSITQASRDTMGQTKYQV